MALHKGIAAQGRAARRRVESPQLKSQGWSLVTGASSGLGAEFARQLAAKGYNLILVARREEKLREGAERLRQQYGVETRVYPFDLSESAAPDALMARVNAEGLTLKVAVNDAGIDVTGRFITQEWDRLKSLINLNVMATAALTKHFARHMQANGGGTLINMSSLGGFFPIPYHAVYGGSKAFILSLTEAIAYEMRDSNVTFTTACPGLVQTQMFVAAGMRQRRWRELAYYHQPEAVVRAVLRAAFSGKPHRIPGLFNKIMALIGRITPRAFNTWYARELMREKEPYT